MLYLSQIIGRPVFSSEKEEIARIKDVVVVYGKEDYPPVIGLVARYNRRLFFISAQWTGFRTQFKVRA